MTDSQRLQNMIAKLQQHMPPLQAVAPASLERLADPIGETTMTSKKRYPDHHKVRQQNKLASHALLELAQLGVEIISVTFRHPHPLIEVHHCPGTERIRHYLKGQGQNDHGHYIKKVAHINGCQVEWNEVRT